MTLYQELAARVGAAESRIVPRLFQIIADETEARILLQLPATAPDLANTLALSSEEVERRVHGLFLKGLVFPSRKTSPPTYRLCRDIIQFHDASVLWAEAPREFLDLWQEWMETEWPELAGKMTKMFPKPLSRLIPVGDSVEAKTTVLDFESISELVHKAGNLAVTKCTCRLHAQKCDRPVEVCIQFNKAADYAIERGSGRKIDAQEALDIFKQAEEAGLVHLTMNQQAVNTLICNCCPCCCQSLPAFIKAGIPLTDPTRFLAEIDSERCSGCGICHERCHFGAISWEEGEGSVPVVNAEKCMGCGLCQVTCPDDAIALVEVRPEEFVPKTMPSPHPT